MTDYRPIKTDVELQSSIKMYCDMNHINMQDFIKVITDRDKHFQKFIKWKNSFNIK